MRSSAATASCAVVLVLAACGQGTAGGVTAGDAARGEPVVCRDASFAAGEPDSMPALDTLPDDVLAAVDDMGEPAVDPSLDWRVSSAGDDEVVLIRELDPADPAAASGHTHATVVLAPITGAADIPDGTWFSWSAGGCSPRLAQGAEDDQADLRLASAPAADDTELALLVQERRCASGRSAEGRIDLDGLTLTQDEVRVQVSVRPPPGTSQDCQGNPWTPFTVELDEPVGDRTVVDGYLVPARPLLVGTEERTFDPEAEDTAAAVARALAFDVWPDYTLLVQTSCSCPGEGSHEVVVRDGEVVSRRASDGTQLAGDAPVPPSLAEVLDSLRQATSQDPDGVADVAVDEGGVLQRVTFDPSREHAGDETTYRFAVDVDSPGDPVPVG